MKIHGIGIDVVEVARMATGIERHGEPYLARIFTDGERAYCDAQHNPAIHYAARFAAKEAVAKAFGTGIGKHAGLKDLEVVRDEGGAPQILLHAAAKDFAKSQGIGQVLISLTHASEYAAANALVIKTG